MAINALASPLRAILFAPASRTRRARTKVSHCGSTRVCSRGASSASLMSEVDIANVVGGEPNDSLCKGEDSVEQHNKRSFFPKRGEELELVCESLAFKAKGVCKVADTGFVVMCDRALPGERLLARIVKRKGSYAEGLKLKTLSIHENAVIPPCEYAANCGGCRTQNLSYEAQVAAKEDQVHQLISRVGRFGMSVPGTTGSYFKSIVPCGNQYHYRNKMEFSFGTQRWIPASEYLESSKAGIPSIEDFALGLHAPGRFDKILDIKKCLLQDEVANQVLLNVHSYCESNRRDLCAYDTKTHTGFLRHLMIRSGHDEHTGGLQLMVNFVTSEYKPELLEPLVQELVATFPEVTSILNNVTSSLASTSVGEQEYILHGSPTITECLRNLVFEISANSFFQTNTGQAEVLYQLVEEACKLRGDSSEVLLDLFCGTGTIGLSMAKQVKHVYGYELVPEAVADARRNAARNNISNATLIQGDLNKLPFNFGSNFPRPDIIITDPNRPGMHPKLIQYMLNVRAPRIVYVSCNPATCARDLDTLCHRQDGSDLPGGYRLVSVQPVDMFPHTPHVECVCALELND